ncbi:MAG TPA: hypothetical protein VFQ23_01415, partial [Anaerolineales bacterium]|nr:hypothetical protein [Anaerolineales bacterium]
MKCGSIFFLNPFALLDAALSYPSNRYLALILFSIIFSSCAEPPTPAPLNMAVVDIPKPEKTQQVQPPETMPTATAAHQPNAESLNASIWVPPYLAETMGGSLEEPLKGLIVS